MKKCSICASNITEIALSIYEPDRFEKHLGVSPLDYRRDWMRCHSCGVLQNFPPQDSIEKLSSLASAYYEVDFQGSSLTKKFELVMDLPKHKSDNALRVDRVLTFLESLPTYQANSPIKVLDIGAGTGVFLARMLRDARASKFEMLAVEPDPIAAEHLRSLNLFSVRNELFTGQADLKNFDLCTANKIVEHVSDPLPLVRQVANALTETGLFYIELPDELTITYRPPNDNILGPLHHHLYNRKSLDYLLTAAGMTPLTISRFFEPSGKISIAAFAVKISALKILAARES